MKVFWRNLRHKQTKKFCEMIASYFDYRTAEEQKCALATLEAAKLAGHRAHVTTDNTDCFGICRARHTSRHGSWRQDCTSENGVEIRYAWGFEMLKMPNKFMSLDGAGYSGPLKQSFRKIGASVCWCLFAAILGAIRFSSAQAQAAQYAPIIVTPPVVDMIDENYVSIMSGKPQFAITAVKLGDVSFTAYNINGQSFRKGGVADHNYGRIGVCQPVKLLPSSTYSGAFECAVGGTKYAIQTVYGAERSTFIYDAGVYTSYGSDSSTFVDNGSTCTLTRRDGTKIIYVAFHASGNPMCQSNNISKILYPDGRIATYYYYGSFSTVPGLWSPILSIATNTGYLLKYNYVGTPTLGGEASVTAINRAFEACDPAAVSCALTYSFWPKATLTFQNKPLGYSENLLAQSTLPFDPTLHYIFTLEDSAHRKHVFELDSLFRVVSYQPPGTTSPVYTYILCSNRGSPGSQGVMTNCFGWDWSMYFDGTGHLLITAPPTTFDQVESAYRNGQKSSYIPSFTGAQVPYRFFANWGRVATNPQGLTRSVIGNATPGTENLGGGSITGLSQYDGTIFHFEASVRNLVDSASKPGGSGTSYGYDGRGNLQTITQTPRSSDLNALISSAAYPSTCTNIITCNKPTWVKDPKANQTDFTYDPTHGGLLTETDPPDINGIRPQKRLTYVPRNAWYLNSSGAMTKDPNAIWVLSGESICRKGTPATPGPGCSLANDEVVTAYDYGPDSGPNNLILRGKTITADGVTQRSCFGHDKQGNTIWETSPNANPSSCPAY